MIKDPTLVLNNLPLGMVGVKRENGITGWSYVRSQADIQKFQGEASVIHARTLRDFSEYVRSARPTPPKGAVWFMILPDEERRWDEMRKEDAESVSVKSLLAREEKLWSEIEGAYNDKVVEFPTFAFLDAGDAVAWLESNPEEDFAQVYRGSKILIDPSHIGSRLVAECIVREKQIFGRYGEFDSDRVDQLCRCIPEDLHLVVDYCDQTDLSIKRKRRFVPLRGGYRMTCERGTGSAFFTVRRCTGKVKPITLYEEPKSRKFTKANLEKLAKYLLRMLNEHFLYSSLSSADRAVCSVPQWYITPKTYWYANLTKGMMIKACTRMIIYLQNIKFIDIRYERIYRRDRKYCLPFSYFAHNSSLLKLLTPFWEERENILRRSIDCKDTADFYKLVIPLYKSVFRVKRNEQSRTKKMEEENERLRLIELVEERQAEYTNV